jgi:hypothetical protein
MAAGASEVAQVTYCAHVDSAAFVAELGSGTKSH